MKIALNPNTFSDTEILKKIDCSEHEPKASNTAFHNHSIRLEQNAKAYNQQFHRGDCKWFWRAVGRHLLEHLVYPVVLAVTFLAACTILLPLSIYYAVTAPRAHVDHLQHKDIQDYLQAEPRDSRLLELHQIRIKAKHFREQQKGSSRRCCDSCLSILTSCFGVSILYDKVKKWLYTIEESHEVASLYLFAPNAEELSWLESTRETSQLA